jgi:hypothetical protein
LREFLPNARIARRYAEEGAFYVAALVKPFFAFFPFL